MLLIGEFGSTTDPPVTVRIGCDMTSLPWADLDDNDNNHSLCLDVTGTALSVSFPAGHVVDPNGDLNPDTTAEVTR